MLNLKRVGAGTTVSFGILVAAVFSILYAVYIPTAVQKLTSDLDISEPLWTILLILVFGNAGTYAFTSAIPSYFLRKRHILFQSLAHIFSSSVASFFGFFAVQEDMVDLPTLPWLRDNPLVAGLYLFTPIVIILYTGLRYMKGEKET